MWIDGCSMMYLGGLGVSIHGGYPPRWMVDNGQLSFQLLGTLENITSNYNVIIPTPCNLFFFLEGTLTTVYNLHFSGMGVSKL